MISFWTLFAAYFIFAIAIFLGQPKHIRKIILDAPEEETAGPDLLVLLLGVALLLTVLEVMKMIVQ